MKDLDNPYAPPEADENDERYSESGGRFADASLGARFANVVIDNVFIFVFIVIFAAFMIDMQLYVAGMENFLGIGCMLVYYVFFEGILGRTPAKWITGTRVIGGDGNIPRMRQILIRTLVRLVPFEPFSFGAHTNGWHDRWSGTRVVRRDPLPVADDEDVRRKPRQQKKRRTRPTQS